MCVLNGGRERKTKLYKTVQKKIVREIIKFYEFLRTVTLKEKDFNVRFSLTSKDRLCDIRRNFQCQEMVSNALPSECSIALAIRFCEVNGTEKDTLGMNQFWEFLHQKCS